MNKIVYLIDSITEYGKLISYCIENDVSVFRTYWDERKRGDRCYLLDWKEKRCLYSDQKYWVENRYEIIKPEFYVDEYGKYQIEARNGRAEK